MPRTSAPTRAHNARYRAAFFQLDVHLDGQPSERADWGAVKVVYRPGERVSYFNLATGGRWVIRNAPLFPADQPGPIETFFYFGLGVPPGVAVRSLSAAATVTAQPLEEPPALETEARVKPRLESYWTNFQDKPYGPLGDPPESYPGGPFDQVLFCRKEYPNQLCGKNECAPAAVSNSLQWLNKAYRLNIDPAKLTIDFWKDAMHWTPEGLKHGAWVDAKERALAKHGLPITSAKLGGGHGAKACKEFERGQAIEVDIGPHASAVTCMNVDADGNIHLTCASDVVQKGKSGNPGNAVSQQVVISPNGEVLSGPPQWARGETVHNFVVQCPKGH